MKVSLTSICFMILLATIQLGVGWCQESRPPLRLMERGAPKISETNAAEVPSPGRGDTGGNDQRAPLPMTSKYLPRPTLNKEPSVATTYGYRFRNQWGFGPGYRFGFSISEAFSTEHNASESNRAYPESLGQTKAQLRLADRAASGVNRLVFEDDQQVTFIWQSPRKIRMRVRSKMPGVKEQNFEAKNLEQLKASEPEAFKFYRSLIQSGSSANAAPVENPESKLLRDRLGALQPPPSQWGNPMRDILAELQQQLDQADRQADLP